MEQKITGIAKDSVAEEMGVEVGDTVLSVDGKKIEDVFDWRQLTDSDSFLLSIRKKNGEVWDLEVELYEGETLGIEFASDLMSSYRACANHCIFCFIDQMPPNMRKTLYFKDDDSRLSFLQGNYITLTNMQKKDVERIIRYRMEPMNVSVHTTNPELRVRMLGNKRAGTVLSFLDDFYAAGLSMNAQIVLCKGYNDREELERTISDLYRYAPVLQSVSVVPVGLTRYRDKLTPLSPFTKEDAKAVIGTVKTWQKKAFRENGMHFVHASDEFYLLAGLPFPKEETYDDYLQLENGVGMGRLLYEEAAREIEKQKRRKERKTAASQDTKTLLTKKKTENRRTFATGLLASPILARVLHEVEKEFPECKRKNQIVGVKNEFFGENVTVAGLLTGKDLIHALSARDLGDTLYLPPCMLRSGEDVFLDDLHVRDLERALNVRVVILKGGGDSLVRAFLGKVRPKDIDTIIQIRNTK